MAVERAMTASTRRIVFGVNVFVQSLLATVVTVGLIWLAARAPLPPAWTDWTRSGVNSLSPRTTQLLRNLDQDIRITCLFPEPNKDRDPVGAKRYREMKDLLELYEWAGGGRVTASIIDPTLDKAGIDALLKRLRELPAYRDEAAPHAQALEQFPALNEEIKQLAASDLQRADELVPADSRLGQNRNFNIVRANWHFVAQEADSVAEDVLDLSQAEIPRYGQAIKEVRDFLTNTQLRLQDALNWMTGEALRFPELPADVRAFFEEAPQRYDDLLARIQEMLDATKDLKDVKLEDVYRELTRWRTGPPVLVEGEQEARVISFWELWERPNDPTAPISPEGDDRVFAGESAISSAILQLTQKEKTAVVFTYYGGQSPIRPDFSQMNPMMRQLPTAPYQQLAELLEKSNFLTEDWDVSKEKSPPKVEGAGRTVYVVFPPQPPPRPNPMRPSPETGMTEEDRKIVEDAIAEAGMAIFLAGWQPPESPFPGATASYAWGEYLRKTWGVNVRANYLTLEFAPNPQKAGWWVPASRQPWLLTTDRVVRLTDHPIARPLQTDRAGFRLVAPVEAATGDDAPQDVTVEPIAEVRPSDDVWAIEDPHRLDEDLKKNQGTRRGPEDVAAPFPIAVAATSADGQKVVVFGSEQFAADALAQATGLQQIGNALILGPLYPANTDLFVNALHWLTGEADRIAVGPRRGDVPRLSRLDQAWAERLPWLLAGVWPALALLVGVGVWLVRRR